MDMVQASPKRRKKQQQQGDSPSLLPEDMLVEIMARLPAKSVGRFRCLSRSWAATLSSSSFVDLHLRRSNDRRREGPPKLFLTLAHYRLHAWQHGGGPVERLTGVLPLPPLNPGCALEVLTCRPCHGLVLLHRLHRGHYVCNPCTGALSLLPDSKIPSKIMTARGGFLNAVSYGLGYCSTTKQHKIVRIFHLHERAECSCEVLSLDVSAHWRPAAHQPPPSCTSLRHRPSRSSTAAVFFNGNLHFLQRDEPAAGCCIITFNVSDEAFGVLMSPPSSATVSFELTVLDGCLCAHSLGGNDDDPYYVWRLGRSGQWEQIFCIQPQADLSLQQHSNWKRRQISPLEIYRGADGRKKIMLATGVLTVVVVDLDGDGKPPELVLAPPMMGDDVDKTIMYQRLTTNEPSRTVDLLEESLVPVGRTNDEIVFSSPSRKAWSDVLKWLPARSVALLSRVCRDWRAVIRSDGFMHQHTLLHAKLQPAGRIVFVEPYHGHLNIRPLPHTDDNHAFGPGVSSWSRRRCRVVCSKPCHGLIAGSCIDRNGTSWEFLCNPIVGYYDRISELRDYQDESFFAGRIGLGYDSRMKRHLPVRLVYFERNLDTRSYRLECYVHLVDTGSMWRRISTPPRPVADMQPAYAHGKLYWMVDPNLGIAKPSSSSNIPGCEILALDVGTQGFEVLQGPPCNYKHITSIVELHGSICVVCTDRSTNAMDVWTMEATGVWSVGHRIELGDEWSTSEETTLWAIDPEGDKVLLNTGRELGYYYPRTRTFETLYRLGELLHSLGVVPLLCHESLLRLPIYISSVA